MLLLLPLGLVAQELKIAVVNTQELYNVIPEVSTYENEMAKIKADYEQQIKIMEDEYTRKMSDYTSQADSLTDNIKRLRMQEIQDLQLRMENFIPMAQEELGKKQEELMMPIREKIRKAIDSVGEENGYTYIAEAQMFLYKGNNAIDVTEKVKAKLSAR